MRCKKNEVSQVTCPVDYAFHRVGGKYKARILWHLAGQNVLRYAELKRTITGVTSKMLTQSLRELESDDLILRTVYPGVLPKVEYRLTDTGKTLIPFIKYLREWGRTQLPVMRLAG